MVTQDEDVGQGKKDNQLMIISESECWILSLLDISVVILLKMSVLLTSFIKLNQKTFYYGIQVFYKVILLFAKILMENMRKNGFWVTFKISAL